MAVDKLPDDSNYQIGFYIPSRSIGTWSDGDADTATTRFTVNVPIYPGIYRGMTSVTSGTLYFPQAINPSWGNGYIDYFIPGFSQGGSTSSLEAIGYISTSYTSFEVSQPAAWISGGNLTLGTSAVLRGAGSNNTLAITLHVLSTGIPAAAVNRLYTSTNITTWTQQTYFTNNLLPALQNNILWDGTWWIIADESTSLKVSTNAVTWTTRAITHPARNITKAGNYYYYSITTTNTSNFVYSTDGTNWTLGSGAPAVFGNGFIHHTTTGQYVRFGNSGMIQSSTNLTNWVTRNVTGLGGNYQVGLYGGGFMSIGDNAGNFVVSTDGITWTTKTGATGDAGWKAIYDNGYHLYGSGSSYLIGFSDITLNKYKRIDGGTTYQTHLNKTNGAYWAMRMGTYTDPRSIFYSTSFAGATTYEALGYIENKSVSGYTKY